MFSSYVQEQKLREKVSVKYFYNNTFIITTFSSLDSTGRLLYRLLVFMKILAGTREQLKKMHINMHTHMYTHLFALLLQLARERK